MTIDAGKHGIAAESQLTADPADLTITAQEDGLHCTNSIRLGWRDADVAPPEGTLKLKIDAQQDGVQAGIELLIGGGDITIVTGGGRRQRP